MFCFLKMRLKGWSWPHSAGGQSMQGISIGNFLLLMRWLHIQGGYPHQGLYITGTTYCVLMYSYCTGHSNCVTKTIKQLLPSVKSSLPSFIFRSWWLRHHWAVITELSNTTKHITSLEDAINWWYNAKSAYFHFNL